MKRYNVSWGDGFAINMEHPVPEQGGRHRQTFTYGTTADVDMSSRDALAAGIKDVRRIYQNEGLYNSDIRANLQQLIERSRRDFPQIFDDF